MDKCRGFATWHLRRTYGPQKRHMPTRQDSGCPPNARRLRIGRGWGPRAYGCMAFATDALQLTRCHARTHDRQAREIEALARPKELDFGVGWGANQASEYNISRRAAQMREIAMLSQHGREIQAGLGPPLPPAREIREGQYEGPPPKGGMKPRSMSPTRDVSSDTQIRNQVTTRSRPKAPECRLLVPTKGPRVMAQGQSAPAPRAEAVVDGQVLGAHGPWAAHANGLGVWS